MKVHGFFVGLDPKIRAIVNVLRIEMLEEVYDLAKKEEGNFYIKNTFINYSLLDEKDKEIYQKSKNVEHQVSTSRSRK